MKSNDAVALIRIMKKSYTDQAEKPEASEDRKVQCYRRAHALDVAIVAITMMEATGEAVPDTPGTTRTND